MDYAKKDYSVSCTAFVVVVVVVLFAFFLYSHFFF